MKKWTYKRKARKNSIPFNPNRVVIADAVEEYLRSGGKITKVIVDEKSYNDFISINEMPSAADEFLNGHNN